MNPVQDIIGLLAQIEQDFTVPKNIRVRVKGAMDILSDPNKKVMAVKASKALEELDVIADDTNLPAYTRTQVWHIVSLLESSK